MAKDYNLALQAAATITADTNSTGVNIPGGTPHRGLWANLIVTSVTGSVIYKIQASDDNTTFVDIATAVPNTVTAACALDIPFTTNKPYVRLASDLASTTSTIVHSAYISNGPQSSVVA